MNKFIIISEEVCRPKTSEIAKDKMVAFIKKHKNVIFGNINFVGRVKQNTTHLEILVDY